jgi:hypothetical protein
MIRALSVALLILLSATALSATAFLNGDGWVDRQGNPVPDSNAMKSIDGFGGWLVVTPDSDWAEKWNTPRETVPVFSEASEVRLGEVLTILPFFLNPLPNENGFVSIGCDLRVSRPDGTRSVDATDLDCSTFQLPGDPRSVFLSTLYTKYVGELGDPYGVWVVEMVLRDNVRGVEVPLKVSFELVDGSK